MENDAGITEEDCWEFFADHMAPLTAPAKSSSISRETSQDTACILVQEFVQALGNAITDIPTHRVSSYTENTVHHCIIDYALTRECRHYK